MDVNSSRSFEEGRCETAKICDRFTLGLTVSGNKQMGQKLSEGKSVCIALVERLKCSVVMAMEQSAILECPATLIFWSLINTTIHNQSAREMQRTMFLNVEQCHSLSFSGEFSKYLGGQSDNVLHLGQGVTNKVNKHSKMRWTIGCGMLRAD